MSQRLAEGPTLTLEHVERQNSGIFRCIADNGVREPVFIDMQLNVLCKSFYFIWNLYSKQFKPILLNYTIEQNEQQNLQFHSNICECGQISMGNSDYDNKNIREKTRNNVKLDLYRYFDCIFLCIWFYFIKKLKSRVFCIIIVYYSRTFDEFSLKMWVCFGVVPRKTVIYWDFFLEMWMKND